MPDERRVKLMSIGGKPIHLLPSTVDIVEGADEGAVKTTRVRACDHEFLVVGRPEDVIEAVWPTADRRPPNEALDPVV